MLDAEPAHPDVSAPNGLAVASEPLAPASPDAADPCDAALPTRCLLHTRIEVPDFSRIAPERWEATMRSIPKHLRHRAVQHLALPFDQLAQLGELAMSDLPPAPADLAREAVRAKPPMAVTPRPDRFRRANRQVNFRLTDHAYLDLAAAAELIGTTPTQLAGMLVRNGVRRMLQDANRTDG